MIEPSATDVLRSLTACFEELIRPALTGTAERSAAATMSGLLRHLRLRLELETEIAAADVLRQAPLLARLEAASEVSPPRPVAAAAAPASHCSATPSLAGDALASQSAIEAALVRLIALRGTQGHTDEYSGLRAALKAEMAAQLQSEAALIHPAFAGFGPRR